MLLYTLFANCKVPQLLGGEELGDRKPTQLLCHMQKLLGDHLGPILDNVLLKELFLPPNMRMVIASANPATKFTKIAEMVDKIMEVATPPTIAPITTTPVSEDFHQLVTPTALPVPHSRRPNRALLLSAGITASSVKQ